MLNGIFASDVDGDIPGKLWHGMFYDRLITTVAGPSGVGKSTIIARMVADFTRTVGNVIWCPEEDPIVLRYKLDAAGADRSKVMIADALIPNDLAELQETIIRDNVKLVVWDTAQKYITTPVQRWGTPLKQLETVLQTTECAALFIHHTNKNVKKSADWQAAIGGATQGLIGSSRMIHLVGRRPDNPAQVVLCPVKDSYGDPSQTGAMALDFDTAEYTMSDGEDREVAYLTVGETGIAITNPVELVLVAGGGEGKGPKPEQLAEAAQFLTQVLANGPVPVGFYNVCATHGACGAECTVCPDFAQWQKDGSVGVPPCSGDLTSEDGVKPMAEDANIAWGTIKRARKALDIIASRKGSGKGSVPFIRLPDGHPALAPNAPTTIK